MDSKAVPRSGPTRWRANAGGGKGFMATGDATTRLILKMKTTVEVKKAFLSYMVKNDCEDYDAALRKMLEKEGFLQPQMRVAY